jgi:peptidoglycan/xylan/chitin deacetylase (PgdA/CDA1 family)
LKEKLVQFFSINNRIFKLKITFVFVFILVLSNVFGYDSKKNAQYVAVFNNIEDKVGEEAQTDASYVIQLASNIENSNDILDEINKEQEGLEALQMAQEEIKPKPEDAMNTFAAGKDFTVKAEEAYTFGRAEGKKYAFLTFDDGPSANITPRVLETLKQNGVKATFCVIGTCVQENPKLLKKELEEGHAIVNHTYSHDYNKIYPNKTINVEVFTAEMEKNQELVNKAADTLMNMRVIRFPAGSFESWKNPMKKLLVDSGRFYIDWNVENGDGLKANISIEEQLENIKTQVSWAEGAKKNIVVLMHDAPAKRTTADALPQIIQYIKSKGYEFRTLK